MASADAGGSVAPESSGPRVTVAMPVYNAGRFLRAAVTSIVRQTFTDWELLIIDDGSTDDAIADIADIADARIRVLRDGANRGLAARLNEAIDLAQGQYFARMDQDDISYPDRLARQLAEIGRHPELDLVAVRCVAIDERDEPVGAWPSALDHEDICARPWMGFYLPHPTWLGKTEWFRRHRYAKPGPYFCEDQELLLRSYATSRFATVADILFAYRVRNRPNLSKSFKTRRTLFGLQLGHFLAVRKPGSAALAALMFGVRVASDLWHGIRQLFAPDSARHPRAADLSHDDRMRWLAVRAAVTRPPAG